VVRRWLLKIYLVIYFALIAGAVITLKRSGALQHIPRGPLIVAVIVAVSLGALVAMTGPRDG
jgi:hypothetical protein